LSAEDSTRIDRRLDGIERVLAQLRSDVTQFRSDLTDFRREMRVLHEDVIGRIQDIADPTDSLRREMRAGDRLVYENLARRIDPLELTVRDHSLELSRRRNRRKS
jgi:hypothetical protein